MDTTRKPFVSDPEGGAEARDEALELVDSDAVWKEDFLNVVETVIQPGQLFTSEDVVEQVGYPPSADRRIIGAAMHAVRRRGLAEPTDHFVPARSRSRHRAPLRTWKRL